MDLQHFEDLVVESGGGAPVGDVEIGLGNLEGE
jgi:hypothetical protein